MFRAYRVGLLLLFAVFHGTVFSYKINKVVSVYYCEEEVEGKIFVHQVQIQNGNTKEVWIVNGSSVTEYEFNKEFSQARAQEILNERRESEEIRICKQKEIHTIRTNVQKQELRLKIKDAIEQVKQSISKLKDNNLQDYYKFSESTINSNDEFDKLCIDDICDAQEIVDKSIDELDIEEIQNISSCFIPYVYKTQKFFLDTVNNAINNCNDTKALKNYLNLLS